VQQHDEMILTLRYLRRVHPTRAMQGSTQKVVWLGDDLVCPWAIWCGLSDQIDSLLSPVATMATGHSYGRTKSGMKRHGNCPPSLLCREGKSLNTVSFSWRLDRDSEPPRIQRDTNPNYTILVNEDYEKDIWRGSLDRLA
jgi:hypothetical protein